MQVQVKAGIWSVVAAAAMVCAAGAAWAGMLQPSQQQLAKAVTQFLTEHGDLCVGKYDWPRDVTDADREAGTNDAVQLPVLERLGLVESVEIPAAPAEPEPTKRYSLTEKGRQFYLMKQHTTLDVHGQPVLRQGDFCVAQLRLDKVVKWFPTGPASDTGALTVRYTYQVESADWLADPEARQVFPVVDRVIHGQGNLMMTVNVQLRDGKWVPVLPGQ